MSNRSPVRDGPEAAVQSLVFPEMSGIQPGVSPLVSDHCPGSRELLEDIVHRMQCSSSIGTTAITSLFSPSTGRDHRVKRNKYWAIRSTSCPPRPVDAIRSCAELRVATIMRPHLFAARIMNVPGSIESRLTIRDVGSHVNCVRLLPMTGANYTRRSIRAKLYSPSVTFASNAAAAAARCAGPCKPKSCRRAPAPDNLAPLLWL